MSIPLYACFRQNFCNGNGICIYKEDSDYKAACDCNDGWFGFDCRKPYSSIFTFPPEDSLKYVYLVMIIVLSILMGIVIGVWLAYRKVFSPKKKILEDKTVCADITDEV